MDVKKNIWLYYLNKKVFVILKDNRRYEGIVIEVQNNGKVVMCMNDKFNRRVCFAVDGIETIQEEGSGR